MKTPVTVRVFKIKKPASLKSMLRHGYFVFELHFEFEIDFDYWPGIYWLKLMVRDYKDDWWEEEKLYKKFWHSLTPEYQRSLTPEYQREEDDPIPF